MNRGARWQAQQQKQTRYVGGKPCSDCGGLEKYTASAKCVPCAHKANRLRKRAASPEIRKKWAEQQKKIPLEKRRMWARRSFLKRQYGLTAAEYERLLAEQNNVCAICYEAFDTINGLPRPAVDHDHATGKVRGILCDRCNHALGHLRDSPTLARRAAQYLEGIRKYDL